MTNSDIIIRCLNGIDALKARQKALGKEHTERIKGLQKLERQIRLDAERGELDLGELAKVSLSPEMSDLLANPVAGL